MRLTWITLLVLLSFGQVCRAQSSHPVPAGLRHAQELQSQNETGFPPTAPSRPAVKVAELKGEAAQLADLAASIPMGVDHVGKGLLDKDLIQNLKRIEKLSKHLRSQLDR